MSSNTFICEHVLETLFPVDLNHYHSTMKFLQPKKDSMMAEKIALSVEKNSQFTTLKETTKNNPRPFHMSTPPASPSKKLRINFNLQGHLTQATFLTRYFRLFSMNFYKKQHKEIIWQPQQQKTYVSPRLLRKEK